MELQISKDVDNLKKQQKSFSFLKFFFLLSSVAIIEAGSLQAAVKPALTYYIQVGAFKSQQAAIQTLKKMEIKSHHSARILETTYQGSTLYQVQVGPYFQLQTAKVATQHLNHVSFIRSYPSASHTAKALKQRTVIKPKIVSKPTTSLVSKKQRPTPAASPSFVFPKNTFPLPATPNRPINSGLGSGSRNLAAEVFGFPYHARSITEGTLGQETIFFNGDLMMPLLGNNNWIGYIDGGAKYGQDEAWNASLGAGIRDVQGNFLWGAYAFMDYNVSSNDKLFWVANPGLEVMSNHWDAHLNGYFPVSNRQRLIETFQGNQRGLETLHFINHNMYDAFFNVVDLAGPGLDGEIGYRFPNFYYLRAFVGGYHFSLTQGPTINGVEGGLEVPINNNVTVLLHDAYDNVQNNTAMATLRVSFGALPKINPPKVQDRMLDPLQRHLGAYQTGAGIPIVNVTQFIGAKSILNNIWFFNPGGPAFVPAAGFANCTYENPCGVLSQEAIDGINSLEQNAHFFFNTGTYNNPLPATGFSLYFGQNFHGRSNYFRRQAIGNERPILNDGLILPGNNALKNLQINADNINTNERAALRILSGAVGKITLENSVLTSSVDGLAVHARGISTQNNTTTLQVTDSEINASLANSFNDAAGIFMNSVGPVNLSNTNIRTIGLNSGFTYEIRNNNSLLNATQLAITNNINGTSSSTYNLYSNEGVNNLDRSQFTMNIANGGGGGGGVFAYNIAQVEGSLSLTNSLSSLNADNFTGNSIGISYIQNTIANVNNSSLNASARNSANYFVGIDSVGTTMLTVNHTTVNLFTNNSGITNGNYGFNQQGGSANWNGVNINVLGINLPAVDLFGFRNGGSGGLVFQNSNIKAIGFTPANVQATAGAPGTNLGNNTCLTIKVTTKKAQLPGELPKRDELFNHYAE